MESLITGVVLFVIIGGITGWIVSHLTTSKPLRAILAIFLYIPAVFGAAYFWQTVACTNASYTQGCLIVQGVVFWIGLIPGFLSALFFAGGNGKKNIDN
ncbi:MAG: hypothetical protein WAZ27_02245 [Minisyncoccia bacterium]